MITKANLVIEIPNGRDYADEFFVRWVLHRILITIVGN